MAGYGDMPFGMNELKFRVGATVVELPATMTLKFKEKVVSGRGRASGQLRALAATPDGVEWEVEGLGVCLEAYALVTGRTVVSEGTSPDRVASLASGNVTRFPYFDIYGKALGVGDDDIHYHLVNAKLTEGLTADLPDDEFAKSSVKGEALAWELIQNETTAELDTSESGS